MTTTAEHLRNTLDGRWRDVKNQMRDRLTDEIFRPHYTPNTVIARTKVAEQLSIMAAAGAADDGFRKEHGGNGNAGAAGPLNEGAAETATIAAVFAQLITTENGEQVNHGVHCVLVPIRDADGNDLPGVTTSDCDYKGGLPGVDNGRIVFDHGRVPGENLLKKYGESA